MPTRCDHQLAGGPLVCTNPRPHAPGHGCTYESTSHVDAEPA
jgi:hypothetical protein